MLYIRVVGMKGVLSVRGEYPGRDVTHYPVYSLQQIVPFHGTAADNAPMMSFNTVEI